METSLNGRVVGERLSEWLEHKRQTTVDLDEQNVVSRSTASGLLNGHTEHPHWNTVRRIARHFGVTVEEFLAGPEAEHPKKAPALLPQQGFTTATQRQ
jgi:transcriptional regulator with XRE-family HTH domain